VARKVFKRMIGLLGAADLGEKAELIGDLPLKRRRTTIPSEHLQSD
jgi:hypothetical protein